MKLLIYIILWLFFIMLVMTSCKRESECDTMRRELAALDKLEAELRNPLPTYKDTHDMALVRVAFQKAVVRKKLKTCEF